MDLEQARAAFAALRTADPVGAALVTAAFQRGLIPGLRALTFVRTAAGTYGALAERPHAVPAHPYSPCVVPDGRRRKQKEQTSC
jgi:hypothetical protein